MTALVRGTIPSLDGIRALAVALVFMAHSGLEHVVPGGLGVTIFFVLSGFLITTLMRVEHARSGRLALGAFYLRRLLRLMPPLVVVVALAALASALGWIDGAFTAGGAAAALLYAGNYHVIANDFHGLPAGLGVIWSLAIEEHFYLLYPLLALVLLRWRPATAAGVLALLCAAVLAWRFVLVARGASVDYLTMATDARVDAILAGAALAFAGNPWFGRVAALPPRTAAGLAAACVALLLGTLLVRDEAFRLTLRFTLQSAAVAGLLWLAVAHAHRRPWRWLGARPLVYLGTVSYTVYLVHHMVLLGLARQFPQAGWALLTFAGALITLALAEPMRRWVDAPFAGWRRRLHREAPSRGAPRAPLAGAP